MSIFNFSYKMIIIVGTHHPPSLPYPMIYDSNSPYCDMAVMQCYSDTLL